MRSIKSIREWLYNNNVSSGDYEKITQYLKGMFPDERFIFSKSIYDGATLIDLVEFIHSEEPQQSIYTLISEINERLKIIQDEITKFSNKRAEG